MKSASKKLLIFIGALFILIVLSVIVIEAFFEKQVGNLFLKGLNKKLTSELNVKSLDLSLLSSFPNGTIVFTDVAVAGADQESTTLLEAKSLSLRFGLSSLFSSKYNVKSILIEDGALYLQFDKNGKGNHNIFIDDGSDEPSNFNLSLKEARLKDIELIYIDQQLETEALWTIEDARLEGQFSNKKFNMKSYAEIESRFIELPEGRYLNGSHIAYDAMMSADLEAGKIDISEMDLVVETNTFSVLGTVQRTYNYSEYDLQVEGVECSVKSILELLPESYRKELYGLSSRGEFDFDGTIIGKHSQVESPQINFAFGLDKGRLSTPKIEYDLKDVSFNGTVSNGDTKNFDDSVLEISGFKASLKGEKIAMDLIIRNLMDPEIDLKFDGGLPLSGIRSLFNIPEISGGDGKIQIDSFTLVGKYKHLIDPTLAHQIDNSGKLNFIDASVRIDGAKVGIRSGQIILDGNKIETSDLILFGPSSEINLSGKIDNILPSLFRDSLRSNLPILNFELDIYSTKTDLDQILKIANLSVGQVEDETAHVDSLKTNVVLRRESLLSNLDGSIKIFIEKFNYENLEAKNLTGDILVADNSLNLKAVHLEAMEGTLLLNGLLKARETSELDVFITGERINISELFRQSDEFGQHWITSKNVKGTLDFKLNAKSYWNEKGEFEAEKLILISDVNLKNGELINFGMMNQLSSFVNINDLKRVRFTEMKNQFAIMDGALYVPTMFVQNNAMNLIMSGKQRFDGRMKYLFKINAGQVLWNKIKRYNPDLTPKKAKEKGFINVYAVVEGTSEDFEFIRGKKNYNKSIENLEGRFVYIRKEVEKTLGRDQILEPDEWQDDPLSPEDN